MIIFIMNKLIDVKNKQYSVIFILIEIDIV